VDWEVVLAGIGAILTAAGGCLLVIREFRRRDRLALKRELDELSIDVSELRSDMVICRRYAFLLGEILAEHGIDVPEPPPLPHEGGWR
jgi:hypothetical protein